MKMLIVDEDRLSRLLLSRALEKAGYGTERGKGKRDSESGEPIILRICDLTMPGTDGLAFLAEIRSTPWLAEQRRLQISVEDYIDSLEGLKEDIDNARSSCKIRELLFTHGTRKDLEAIRTPGRHRDFQVN